MKTRQGLMYTKKARSFVYLSCFSINLSTYIYFIHKVHKMRCRGFNMTKGKSFAKCSSLENDDKSQKKVGNKMKSIINKWKVIVSVAYFIIILTVILYLMLPSYSTLNLPDYENTRFADDVNYKSINKSKLDPTKFINTKLNAQNVLEIPIISSVIDELIDYYKLHIKSNVRNETYIRPILGAEGHEFYSVSPPWNSDIRWISVNNLDTYHHFLPCFEEMELINIFRSIIDFESRIVVYSIFFVVRSKISGHNWHVDFERGTNVNGFTLLTPLQDANQIHLAYKDRNENIKRYEYKKNVGIVFGENFLHSTDIAFQDNQEVIFCFSFGTDKMRDWKYIKETVATQGEHYTHPFYGFLST